MCRAKLRGREFEKIFKKGSRSATDNVAVYVLPNRFGVSRVGFAVSRKVTSVVGRNRVRRLVREVCRLNKGWFKPGYDYVILWRGSTAEADYRSVQSNMKAAIRKLGGKACEDHRVNRA